MRRFDCACGARVFFENVHCLSCGSELGFLPDVGRVSAVALQQSGDYLAAENPEPRYRKCQNYSLEGVCNWMVRTDDELSLCQACRLNQVIPNLSEPENREKWARVEVAKRRLVYTLNALALPVVPRSLDPERGLAFDIKSDTPDSHVITGHAEGLVTLNLAEADPLLREKMRVSMNERYRTLLGHFRHEVGHYYWDVLLSKSDRLQSFRELFGDERRDYGQALREYYRNSPADWTGDYVSAYAQAHPWEDWAETWAHYMHMLDTLETASSFGFSNAPELQPPISHGMRRSSLVPISVAIAAEVPCATAKGEARLSLSTRAARFSATIFCAARKASRPAASSPAWRTRPSAANSTAARSACPAVASPWTSAPIRAAASQAWPIHTSADAEASTPASVIGRRLSRSSPSSTRRAGSVSAFAVIVLGEPQEASEAYL